MSKVRVYELAKELGVESKVIVAKLQEMGEFVRSASSTIEPPVVRRLREEYPAAPAAAAPAKPKTAPKPKPAPKGDAAAEPAGAADAVVAQAPEAPGAPKPKPAPKPAPVQAAPAAVETAPAAPVAPEAPAASGAATPAAPVPGAPRAPRPGNNPFTERPEAPAARQAPVPGAPRPPRPALAVLVEALPLGKTTIMGWIFWSAIRLSMTTCAAPFLVHSRISLPPMPCNKNRTGYFLSFE